MLTNTHRNRDVAVWEYNCYSYSNPILIRCVYPSVVHMLKKKKMER